MATLAITQGERPSRPAHPTFTGNWWALTQRCWDIDPRLRPEASEVLQTLYTLSVAFILVIFGLNVSSRLASFPPGNG